MQTELVWTELAQTELVRTELEAQVEIRQLEAFDSLRLSVVVAAEIAIELTAELKERAKIQQPKELKVLLIAIHY